MVLILFFGVLLAVIVAMSAVSATDSSILSACCSGRRAWLLSLPTAVDGVEIHRGICLQDQLLTGPESPLARTRASDLQHALCLCIRDPTSHSAA